jgi:hypothetical protein
MTVETTMVEARNMRTEASIMIKEVEAELVAEAEVEAEAVNTEMEAVSMNQLRVLSASCTKALMVMSMEDQDKSPIKTTPMKQFWCRKECQR